ncbi:MAG: hypothetical protein EHM14_05745 [Methanothrix sp.]|nr:MAG: hypothetical protein EHM14_05745 [Methanothrix sp.]
MWGRKMRYIVQPVIDNATNFPGTDGAKKYWIASINSGLVASSNGAVVQQKWNEEDSQQWRFESLSAKDLGYHKIVSVKDKRVLCTKADSANEAEEVVTENWSAAEGQKWKLIYLGSGKFRIESKIGGRILKVSEKLGAKILAVRPAPASSKKVIIYEKPNFLGKSQELAPGKYNAESLKLGAVSSIKVSDGLLVTLFEKPDFKGQSKVLSDESSHLAGGNTVSSIKIKSNGSGSSDPRQQWQISEVSANLKESIYKKTAILFQQANFQGPSQEVGLGKFDKEKLTIGEKALNSVRVAEGLKVTIYQEPGFKGGYKSFIAGDHYVGDDFKNRTSSVKVEPVVTIFEKADYQGQSQALGVGDFGSDAIELAAKKMGSIKVPSGLIVNARQGEGSGSLVKTFDDDEPSMSEDFKGPIAAIDVYAIGLLVPENALIYGSTVSLKSANGKCISAEASGELNSGGDCSKQKAMFTIVRSGNTKHNSYINFGDIVSLKAQNNKYVTVRDDGSVAADKDGIMPSSRFTVVRTGPTADQSFVSLGDTIGLMAASGNYLSAEEGGRISAVSDMPEAKAQWIFERSAVPSAAVHAGAVNISACVADACAAAACGAAGRLILPCGAASVPIAICGSDVVGLSWESAAPPQNALMADSAAGGVCVMLACSAKGLNGVAFCGADAYRQPCGGDLCMAYAGIDAYRQPVIALAAANACGGEACGGEACGAKACGGKACGGEACGADACGGAACPAKACGGDACGGAACVTAACPAKACGLEACGGAVCAAAACPGKACGADACGGAICGGDACAAKACGGEACGGDACGGKACGGFACPAKACGADACGAVACAAKACAANACPADACAAKACAINVIPFIPVSG